MKKIAALFFCIVPMMTYAWDDECELYPLNVSSQLIANAHVGQYFEKVPFGKGATKASWLTWDGRNNAASLAESLTPPGNADIYINPDNHNDTMLSVFDWVPKRTGVKKNYAIQQRLNHLLGRIISIPVWSEKRGETGDVDYQVHSFARVKLTQYQLKNNNSHGYDDGNGGNGSNGKGWVSFVYKGTINCDDGEGNAPPVAEDDNKQGLEDEPISITLVANDDNGDTITYHIVSPPSNGTLNGGGSEYTYTPNPGFFGNDSFSFIANDGSSDSNQADVSITILNSNEQSCELYPITLPNELLNGAHIGQHFERIPLGVGYGNFSWLSWDGQNNAESLAESLVPPGNSEIYINPDNHNDTLLSINDWAQGRPGVMKSQAIRHNLDNLLGQVISIPVWQNKRGQGSHFDYKVASFVKVKLTSYRLKGNGGHHSEVNDKYNYGSGSGGNGGGGGGGPGWISLIYKGPSDDCGSGNAAPVAEDLETQGPQDTPLNISVVATDADNDNLTYNLVTPPENGFISGNGPEFLYTPNPGFFGLDNFTYTVNDGAIDSNEATVSIAILKVSDQNCELYPITVSNALLNNAQIGQYFERIPFGKTMSNASWLTWDGRNTTMSLIESLTPPGNSEIYINPDDNSDNQLSINDWVKKRTGVRRNYDLQHTLNNLIGEIITIPVWQDKRGNYSHIEYQIASYAKIKLVNYKLKSHHNGGHGYGGDDNCGGHVYSNGGGHGGGGNGGGTCGGKGWISFIYKGPGSCDDENIPPVAEDQNLQGAQNESINITVIATDADSDPLTYSIIGQPTNGSLTGDGPNYIYTPNNGFVGLDSFSFVANDGLENSNEAQIAIAIIDTNSPPTAEDLEVDVIQDTESLVIVIASDPDLDPLTYVIVDQPTNGTLSGSGPDYIYTPNPGFTGTDTFSFVANDGSVDSNVATATINVIELNNPPVAEDIFITGVQDEEVPLVVIATDADDDPLTYEIVDPPQNGILIGDGPNYVYVPSPGFVGEDTFSFIATDGELNSNEATVTISIEQVNNPPVADNLTVDVLQDTASAVLVSASDADDDPLTYEIITQPTNGTLTGSGPDYIYTPNPGFIGTDTFSFVANDGTVNSNEAVATINVIEANNPPVAEDIFVTGVQDEEVPLIVIATDADDDPLTYEIVDPPQNGILIGDGPNYVYVPSPGFVGEDTFSFIATDGDLNSNEATVTISIEQVNNPPVADNLTVDVLQDTASAVLVSASDADDDPLTYEVITQPTNGTLTGSGPNYIYTPNPGFTGTDTFSFVANDGTVNSNEAVATINVIQSNRPPEAEDGSAITFPGFPAFILVDAFDPDGDPLTYIIVSQPDNGTLSNQGNEFMYTPNAGFTGFDQFTFKVNDGELDSNTAIVSIAVTDEL